MATKRVLTVAEVVEKLQNSGSEDEIGEDDESGDDFDGYLEETETEGWWNRREMDGNSDEEGNGSDSDDKESSNVNNTEDKMENDVPAIPLTP